MIPESRHYKFGENGFVMCRGLANRHCKQKPCLLLIAIVGIALLVPIANSQASTINQGDISILKAYADAFNQSRNYITPSGPAEQYCLSSGTFLTTLPCRDLPTCTQTANLVCTVSGQACEVDVLAADILAYKNGVDALNAAYAKFMSGYNSFSPSNLDGSLNQMDSGFSAMKSAADTVSQSKLRLPNQIPCPCTNSADCCIGRCPEAHFNYTAIAAGKAAINNIRLKNCIDGTPGGQCSAQKPMECALGQLVSDSGKCGCPTLMRPAADGKACEYIPCNDNGASVADGRCSTNNVWKKCVQGTLYDKAAECGCPAGQFISGNLCFCPMKSSQVCSTANVTKNHLVTYVFDRGNMKTVKENYTFERTSCYSVQSNYTGAGCTQLVASVENSTPISETPEPQLQDVFYVPCATCPAVCNRSQPNGLLCGSCSCPPNLGFCSAEGARVNASNGKAAYCANGLLEPQKEDYATCAHGFECKAGECRNSICYSRQNDSLQLFIDWVQGLLGIKKSNFA